MQITITGITGTLGTALTKTFLARGFSVRGISRDPQKQKNLMCNLRDSKIDATNLRLELGDIAEYKSLDRLLEGSTYLVHAAALKHVDLGQQYTSEYTRVNIVGTERVKEAATRAGVDKCVLVSTDKAVEPVNLYGKTKAVAEHIWLSGSQEGQGIFNVVRYGNVMGSNGSVIPIWRDTIKNGGRIRVSSPGSTRFFMTLSDAMRLIEYAMYYGESGIHVMTSMPAFDLWDLASEFAPQAEWEMYPLGYGEKMHECLVSVDEWFEPACGATDIITIAAKGRGWTTDTLPDWSSSRTARKIKANEILKILDKGA